MPRLPVHAPRSGIASMSPVGVTRLRAGVTVSRHIYQSPRLDSPAPETPTAIKHVVFPSKDDSDHSEVAVGALESTSSCPPMAGKDVNQGVPFQRGRARGRTSAAPRRSPSASVAAAPAYPQRLSTSRRWSSASLEARIALDPDPVPLAQLRNRAICRYTARNI